MREALEQPTDPLRQNALLALEELIASGRGIVDLGGIEYLRNLVFLNLAQIPRVVHQRTWKTAVLYRYTQSSCEAAWAEYAQMQQNAVRWLLRQV